MLNAFLKFNIFTIEVAQIMIFNDTCEIWLAAFDVQAHRTVSALYMHRVLPAKDCLKRYFPSNRLHDVKFSTTNLPVHRSKPMVRVTFWVLLLLLVLVLKQSNAVSDDYSDLENDSFDLESYIKRIRLLKQRNENLYEECKVSVCEYIYKPFSLERYIIIITELKHGNEILCR